MAKVVVTVPAELGKRVGTISGSEPMFFKGSVREGMGPVKQRSSGQIASASVPNKTKQS